MAVGHLVVPFPSRNAPEPAKVCLESVATKLLGFMGNWWPLVPKSRRWKEPHSFCGLAPEAKTRRGGLC